MVEEDKEEEDKEEDEDDDRRRSEGLVGGGVVGVGDCVAVTIQIVVPCSNSIIHKNTNIQTVLHRHCEEDDTVLLLLLVVLLLDFDEPIGMADGRGAFDGHDCLDASLRCSQRHDDAVSMICWI